MKHYVRLAALAEEEGLIALQTAMEDQAADEDEHRQETNRLLEQGGGRHRGVGSPTALRRGAGAGMRAFRRVEPTGFEPVTSWLQTRRSPD